MNSFFDQFSFDARFAGCLGAEEEYWTVDPETGRLVPASVEVFKVEREGRIRPELPIHQIEAVTGICRGVAELQHDMEVNLARLHRLGEQFGFMIDTTPTPPIGEFEVRVYPGKPRYLEIQKQVPADVLRNGWITGLHIHYGCRNMAEAIKLLNGLRRDLPMFLALSARSPLGIDGRATGRVSERFFTYLRMQPNIVPPHIESAGHFEQIAGQQGFIDDPKRCWWAVRINPIGTVEVRIFDMQGMIEHSAELAALVSTRARMILAEDAPPVPAETSETIHERLVEAAASAAFAHSNAVAHPVEAAISFAQTHEFELERRMLLELRRRRGRCAGA